MKEIILIKNGELALKGLNRGTFEDRMVKTIKYRISGVGKSKVYKSQSAVYVEGLEDNYDYEKACNIISKIFGISAYSRACVAEKDLNDICEKTIEFLGNRLSEVKTFKVEAKRSDKQFPLKSPEISREVGGYILSRFPRLKVDVHNPDLTVTVEIRESAAYVRGEQTHGAGGLPIGTGGKGAILISGGIDSPVAAWTMARRGLELVGIHFASPPYTGPRAEQKVRDLLGRVSQYSGKIPLFIVPFTEIQVQISKNCPEELFTVIMRRFMMRVAIMLAKKENCKGLITGESLGQVASQTLDALVCTDAVCTIPVLRPLIGSDKEEIVKISRKIGAFDISVLPFEDCCTVFTPKHPRTKPSLEMIENAEKALDIEGLCNRAFEGAKFEMIRPENFEI